MGLFDSILGGFEKLERRGNDALARGQALQAYHHFRDALEKAKKNDPLAAEHLKVKVDRSRLLFIEAKIQESVTFLEDEVAEAALESLQIAQQYLEGSDAALAAKITQLKARAERILEPHFDPGAGSASGDGLPVGIGSTAVEGQSNRDGSLSRDAVSSGSERSSGSEPSNGVGAPGTSRPPRDDGTTDLSRAPDQMEAPGWDEIIKDQNGLDTYFEQLLGSLPPEDQSEAGELGRIFRKGFVAHQFGQRDVALDALSMAAQEHPDSGLVLEHLAMAFDQQGRTDDAQARYREALEKAPQRINARLALASIHAGIDPPAGIQSFEHWRILAESHAARAGTGGAEGRDLQTSADDPRFAEALALLDEGTRTDAGNAATYFAAAAEICLARACPKRAAGFITRAMELGSDGSTHLWHLYGAAMEMSGSLDEAESAYDRAVQLGGHAMLYRAEFAKFALRHRRALKEASDMLFQTCLGCQASRPAQEELDYYGFLMTQIQIARGELKQALEGIDRLLHQGAPEVLEPELRRMRAYVKDKLSEPEPAEGGG
ncbi:MAG: tetratricopeptide repeat protein [Candidatus Eisenbacteria sp.]|nr:tetratricopeptide repeat protein [Candidatus Eisenbacteria bacterium]